MRHGWDGEAGRHFLLHADGEPSVERRSTPATTTTSTWPGWARRSTPSSAAGATAPQACCRRRRRRAGRWGGPRSAAYGWDGERDRGFRGGAAASSRSRVAVVPPAAPRASCEPGLADRLYDEAAPHAARLRAGPRSSAARPTSCSPALAELAAAINDAPLDDLDIEDEVFTADRVRGLRGRAQLGARPPALPGRRPAPRAPASSPATRSWPSTASAPTLGRPARHLRRPQPPRPPARAAAQGRHDALAAPRSSRSSQTIDTWNAESNDHMIGVNERLGYRVMGRELAVPASALDRVEREHVGVDRDDVAALRARVLRPRAGRGRPGRRPDRDVRRWFDEARRGRAARAQRDGGRPRCRPRGGRRRGWCCSRASPTTASCSSPTTASRKGAELAAEPAVRAALPVAPAGAPGPGRRHRDRAVRRGASTRTSPSRPRGVPARRLGLATSRACVGLPRRAATAAYDAADAAYPDDVPVPDEWGGYRVAPRGRGVLAGPTGPDARPARLPPHRSGPRGLAHRAPGAPTSRPCRCWSATRRRRRRPGTSPRPPPVTAAWCSSPARPASARPSSSTPSSREPAPRSRVAVGRVRRVRHAGSARPAARDAAGPARRRLARRAPTGTRSSPGSSEALARPGPAASSLVVEDAHWADDATLDLMRHLARRVHRLRALVLVTYRSEEATGQHPLRLVLGDVASAAGIRRIDLAPAHARTPSARLVGTAEEPVGRRRAVPDDRGQPVLRHRGDRGRRRAPSRAACDDAVLSRMARLTEDARDGSSGRPGRAARRDRPSSPRSRPAATAALDEALGARRAPARGGARDVPPRARAAHRGRGGAGSCRRDAIHRRILRRLAATRAADPARWPTTPRRPGGDEAAPARARGRRPRGVARRAPGGGPSSTSAALRHSAGAPAPSTAPSCSAALAYELLRHRPHGRGARRPSGRRWRSGRELGDVERVGDAQRWLSRLSWFAGDSAAGRGVRRRRLRDAGRDRRDARRGDGAQQPRPARDAGLRPRRHAGVGPAGRSTWSKVRDDAEAEEVRVHALNNLGTIEVDSGDAEQGWPLLEESLERSQAADLHEHAARAFTNLAAAGRAPAPARCGPAAPGWLGLRLLPRAGPRRLGPLHAGLARRNLLDQG